MIIIMINTGGIPKNAFILTSLIEKNKSTAYIYIFTTVRDAQIWWNIFVLFSLTLLQVFSFDIRHATRPFPRETRFPHTILVTTQSEVV